MRDEWKIYRPNMEAIMDAEKFVKEVLSLWMEENGINGTVEVTKKT